MTVHPDSHLVPLGDSGWWLWRECALRSAGFPAARVTTLGDRRLAAVVDGSVDAPDGLKLDTEFAAAAARLTTATHEIAADPRFREAVTWQNPGARRRCLDRLVDRVPCSPKTQRRNELTVASYLQRYALKNDTIGFFGPIAWAHWSDRPEALRLTVGDRLLARRRVYFECWTIDALAQTFSRDPELIRWLHPQLAEADLLVGRTIHRAHGDPVALAEAEAELLVLCDGHRSVEAIARSLVAGPSEAYRDEADVIVALHSVRERGLIRLDLEGPIETEPESTLRKKLLSVPDPGPRERALMLLDELVTARDRVAAAAGTHDRLLTELEQLNDVFERVTGEQSQRRAGEMYAGRTPVYEDTVRDVTVELGQPLRDALANPLGLLLDSASWFVGRAADDYQHRFLELFERCRARLGTDVVPLYRLFASAVPDLVFSFRGLPPLVADLVPELQSRWARILAIPAGVRRHTVTAGAIAGAVHDQFPRANPRWSSAIHHSPDIMLATDDVAAVNRGDYLLVLGELHLAANNLDSRNLVEQHSRPRRLLTADQQDRGGFRVLPVPSKESRSVNSRTYPPTLLSPDYVYWCPGSRTTGAPGPTIPVSAMTVVRDGDRLLVRFAGEHPTLDLLEVMGEYLSAAVMNGFAPVATDHHRPRVMIDRLVLAREAWAFRGEEIGWALGKDRHQRYRDARRWRRSHGLPERAFYRVHVEDKPIFVDFSSISLIELFAKEVRRSVGADPAARVTLTEVLPDIGQQWLRDRAGAAYTSEIRMVAVDPSAPGLVTPRSDAGHG